MRFLFYLFLRYRKLVLLSHHKEVLELKVAADFRLTARKSLRGKWLLAVAAGLIASLLGGIGSESYGFRLDFNLSDSQFGLKIFGIDVLSIKGSLESVLHSFFRGGAATFIVTVVIILIHLFLSGVITAGYSRFNLDMVDGRSPELYSLFGYFPFWKNMMIAGILRILYVFLWSILFIVPGIIAAYSYSMTGYILAERPDMTASEALALSKRMMHGNRWRLFCLHLSFIGWSILCMFTFGLGHLWLTPYIQASNAAFFRDLSGSSYGYSQF